MSGQVINVGFIGNPNCGKTTLFNAYTGANLKVANWPGVTVEKKEGRTTTRSGSWTRQIHVSSRLRWKTEVLSRRPQM